MVDVKWMKWILCAVCRESGRVLYDVKTEQGVQESDCVQSVQIVENVEHGLDPVQSVDSKECVDLLETV